MPQVHSFCRTCLQCCPLDVTVEEGTVVNVVGDRSHPVYRGFSCTKGRAQGERLRAPERLTAPMRRRRDGSFERVSLSSALDDIAARLEQIRDRRGPNAIAGYWGTYAVTNATAYPFANAFMKALGSTMVFTPNTIDKPGKNVAPAFLGGWSAPAQGFDDPEVALLIGINPVVSFQGTPFGGPGWITQATKAGLRLIVIDPRLTETAARADLHIQPRPGADAAILACLIRTILREDLHDHAFVSEEVEGVESLASAVEAFTPEHVASLADVEPDVLVQAARVFAGAKRGYATAGTGPSMSGPGTLVEYLVLVLQSLCGRWLRAGERVRNAPALMATPTYRAQARPQQPARDRQRPMRSRGLTATPAGLPTSALADEMLLDGTDQVRALLSVGGNPVGAWPDQLKVVQALEAVDLLVQIDPWMSTTARLADYVIPPLMAFEVASVSHVVDGVSDRTAGLGAQDSYAQYSSALVPAPEGSDLIEEWQFFWELARRMGYPLTISPAFAAGGMASEPFEVDTSHERPSTEDVLDRLTSGARVSLQDLREHPDAAGLPPEPVRVLPKTDGWSHRLNVGHPDMLRALHEHHAELVQLGAGAPFRLICRRGRGLHNTNVNDGRTTRGVRHNPAFLHPEDLAELGLEGGDRVNITSDRASIPAIVEPDATLRRGLVSMTHGYGLLPGDDDDPEVAGSATGRLIGLDTGFDPWSGQPRMSNVPVTVTTAGHGAGDHTREG